MRAWNILLGLALVVIVQAENRCANDVQASEESAYQEIVHWWRKMAVMKPLPRCKEVLNMPARSEQFHNMFAHMTIRYYAELCTLPGEGQTYQHEGKLKNGLPEGGVKLSKLALKQVIHENRGGQHVCYHFSPFQGYEVTHIAGKFLDGALQGQARLTFEDKPRTAKLIVIGNFNKGYPEGLMREFDSTGKITRVTNRLNASHTSHSWRLHGQTLIYANEGMGLNLQDIRGVIFRTKFENGSLTGLEHAPIAGVFNRQTGSVTQIRDVISLSVLERGNFGDCMLELQVVEEQGSSNHKDEVLVLMPESPELIKTKLSRRRLQEMCDEEISTINENHTSLFTWIDDLGIKMMSEDGMFWGTKFILNHLLDDEEMPFDHSSFLPILSDIVIDVETYNHSARIQGSSPVRIGLLSAGLDEENRLHGYCHLRVHKNDLSMVPKDYAFGWRYTNFKATFDHGSVIDGVIEITTEMESWVLATVKHGTLHGPILSYGVVPLLPVREGFRKPVKVGKGIGYVGFRRNGYLFGTFWLAMQNFGYLHGTVDSSKLDATSISGDAHSFIFYDGDLAMVGKFEDRVMKDAGLFHISEMGCNTFGLPQVFTFVPHTGEYANVRFWYDPADNVTMGGGPPGVPDPYESKVSSVVVSKIPGSGEGVIAKVDIPANRPASICSGYVLNQEQEDKYLNSCALNLSLPMDERRRCIKYGLMGDGFYIQIPPKFDNPESFTLGKGLKVNHQFSDLQDTNVSFENLEHPRWGLIMGLVTSRHISKGEEQFTDYGYPEAKAPPADFPWYFELRRKLIMEKRSREEEGENKKKSNYVKTSKKGKRTGPKSTQEPLQHGLHRG